MGAFRRPSVNQSKTPPSNNTPKGSISETVPESKLSPTDLYSMFPVKQEEIPEEIFQSSSVVKISQKKPTPALHLDLDDL